MQLQTAICCVNYDDFLAITLPHNLSRLGSVTVLTSPYDHATISLAKSLGVQLFITEAWYHGGAFNKALALNGWVTHASAVHPESWLLSLDADILLYQPVEECLGELHPGHLYSLRRRMCPDKDALAGLLSGDQLPCDFPVHTVPLIEGKLWGTIDAQNPAGLAGYFQMWCPAACVGLRRFPVTGTAEAYDLLFGLSYPDSARHYLHLEDALHIGPPEVNWAGRQSPRWEP